LQDPPKFTQIGIFGLKTNHLATLVVRSAFFGAGRFNSLEILDISVLFREQKIITASVNHSNQNN
jgi:hypothetical protein